MTTTTSCCAGEFCYFFDKDRRFSEDGSDLFSVTAFDHKCVSCLQWLHGGLCGELLQGTHQHPVGALKCKKCRNNANHADQDNASHPAKKKRIFQPRKRFNAKTKLMILEDLKVHGSTLTAVAQRHGLAESTLRGWKKEEKELQQAIQSKYKGALKAKLSNNLERMEKYIIDWYEANQALPHGIQLPISIDVVKKIALEAKKDLLGKHAREPFLSEKETTALHKFTASRSWASRFTRKQQWKQDSSDDGQDTDNDNINHAKIKAELDQLRRRIARIESQLQGSPKQKKQKRQNVRTQPPKIGPPNAPPQMPTPPPHQLSPAAHFYFRTHAAFL